MTRRAKYITLRDLGEYDGESLLARPLIAEVKTFDRTGPVIEFHEYSGPPFRAIGTRFILGRKDQGPHLGFPPPPLPPPLVLVCMVVGTLVRLFLLGGLHGSLLSFRAGEGTRTL